MPPKELLKLDGPKSRLDHPPQKIACGFYHSAVISHTDPEREKHEAWVWGRNKYNELGLEKQAFGKESLQFLDKLTPVKVDALKGDIYEVACGSNHTVFLKKKDDQAGGVLYATGLGNSGRLGLAASAGDDENVTEVDIWFTDEKPRQTRFNWASGTRVLRVVCGADHTLCVATDGRLYAWGVNDHGQCGTGSSAQQHRSPTPVQLPEGANIVHFAAGAQHSLCAEGGSLWTWGNGRNGRLGLGSKNSFNVPQVVKSLPDVTVTFVAGGEAHSACLDSKGEVFTWGCGNSGRLGVTEDEDKPLPVRITMFQHFEAERGGVRLKSLALGGFHTLFLEATPQKGRLYVCGSGAAVGKYDAENMDQIWKPQLLTRGLLSPDGRLLEVVQIAAGMFHSLALLEHGTVLAWGVGSHGRLGIGEEKTLYQPTLVKPTEKSDGYKGGYDFSLRSKFEHTEGQDSRLLQSDSHLDDKFEVCDITSGSMHTFARTFGGKLFGWGCSSNGQLGIELPGSTYFWSPHELALGVRKVKLVVAGLEHTLAITTTEELWAWGRGTEGQLGTGALQDEATPVLVKLEHSVVTCSAGEVHSAAVVRIRGAGTSLYTWGEAEHGVLGLGPALAAGLQSSPQKVEFNAPSQEEILAVECSPNHTVVIRGPLGALDSFGQPTTVWSFGNGWYGRLGVGDKRGRTEPTKVNLPRKAIQSVAVGADHTCAVTFAGELWVWGRGTCIAESEDVLSPKLFNIMEGLPKIQRVVCGVEHTIAIADGGQLYGWGSNEDGQLGLGSKIKQQKLPEQIKSIPGAVEKISTGNNFSVAVLKSGDVYAWGNQSCGRLGLAEKVMSQTVWEPSAVLAQWSMLQAEQSQKGNRPKSFDGSDGSEGNVQDNPPVASTEHSKKKLHTQKVISWVMLQTRLKQQDPRCYEPALVEFEAHLEKKIADKVDYIRTMPSIEKELYKLQKQIGESLTRNKLWFNKVQTPDPKALKTKVDPRIYECLSNYQQLLWVLQQQTCYLGQLSQCVAGEEQEVYYETLERIFADTYKRRLSNLQQITLRQVISKEAEAYGMTVENFLCKESVAFQVFSRYALSQVNCKKIIHPILGCNKSERLTLLLEIQAAAQRMDDMFFLSSNDLKEYYKDSGENRVKDETELKTQYSNSLEKFRQFMTGPFLRSLKHVELPEAIQQLLCHVTKASQRWKPTEGNENEKEQKRNEPAMKLWCSAIVCPLLANSGRYATEQNFLRSSKEIISNDPMIHHNMSVIASFLEQMLENSIDKKEKVLNIVAKQVYTSLIEYIQEQMKVVDDVAAELVLDALIDHFSLTKSDLVFFSQAHLMKLSNIIKESSNELRIKENDIVDRLCKDIPFWEKEAIRAAESNSLEFNFFLDPRYMIENEIVACHSTARPLPNWMCHDNSSSRLILSISSFSTSEEDPTKFFEGLFRQLPQLHSKTFPALKDECKSLRASLDPLDGGNELIAKLEKAERLIDEQISVGAQAQDMMQTIVETLEKREGHLRYLQQLDHGLKDIEQKCVLYQQSVSDCLKELKQMLSFSLDLSLPKALTDKSKGKLKFTEVSAQMKLKSSFDVKAMHDLQCTFVPVKTYSVAKLMSSKIVIEIHPPFNGMQKTMNITIRKLEGGGAEVVASIVQGKVQSIIKTINLEETKLDEMKHASALATLDLQNPGEQPFLTCRSNPFAKLIAQLGQGEKL